MKAVCAVCGNEIHERPTGRSVTYTGPDGIVIKMDCDDAVSGLLKTANGDFWVCEACFPEAASKRFSGNDLAELHFQFGLEYQDKKSMEMARLCFLRAIAICRKAEYLAALGTVCKTREEELRCYKEALKEDPECLIARLNLASRFRNGAESLREDSSAGTE